MASEGEPPKIQSQVLVDILIEKNPLYSVLWNTESNHFIVPDVSKVKMLLGVSKLPYLDMKLTMGAF